jgi:hypothetical protein
MKTSIVLTTAVITAFSLQSIAPHAVAKPNGDNRSEVGSIRTSAGPGQILTGITNPGPDMTYTIQIIMEGTVTQNTAVSISSGTQEMFSTLPSSVTVPAGSDRVTFTVQSSSEVGEVQVTASANGKSVTRWYDHT